MSNSKHLLNLNVLNFEGDPSLLDFFFDQVRSYATLNKLKPEETIAFLKGKLSGPALKFLTQSPSLYKSNDFETIEKAFRDFFSPMSSTQALVELNNLILLPQESIKNFAHRINILTPIVYPQVNDKNALDQIKFTKFISSIPSNFRTKLQEEDIKLYDLAVQRAQQLQEIAANESILQAQQPPISSVNTLSKQIVELSEKINRFTFSADTKKDNKKDQCASAGSPQKSKDRDFKQNFKTRHIRTNYSNNQRCKPPLKSQLCSRRGHSTIKCFKWQRAISKSDNNESNMSIKFQHTSYNHNQLN